MNFFPLYFIKIFFYIGRSTVVSPYRVADSFCAVINICYFRSPSVRPTNMGYLLPANSFWPLMSGFFKAVQHFTKYIVEDGSVASTNLIRGIKQTISGLSIRGAISFITDTDFTLPVSRFLNSGGSLRQFLRTDFSPFTRYFWDLRWSN